MIISFSAYSSEKDYSFNVEMLNLDDNDNIDVSRFSHEGYIQPGTYKMPWMVNKLATPETEFKMNDIGNGTETILCLSPENIQYLALKKETLKEVQWTNNGECLDWDSIPGSSYRVDFGSQTLYISLPKSYMEYTEVNWDPPSRWEEGVNGILLDYNVNARTNNPRGGGYNSYAVNSNGTTGINLGAWRFRGNWQGNIHHNTGSNTKTTNSLKMTQIYAYRALKELQAQLTIGESFFDSNIFASFRFLGVNIHTDLNMIPPNLRDYAPEVTGIARTDAQLIISQAGKVIYQSQIPAGPFTVSDLPGYANGDLDVRIEEQDGTVQEYQVSATSIPYLTRPGSVRYKFTAGKPMNDNRKTEGNPFISGEFSWGMSNNSSLFAGTLNSQDYNAVSIGLGRNLFELGSFSVDITKSRANLNNGKTANGTAIRANYLKSLAQIDSQFMFSGSWYTNDQFITMSDYLSQAEGTINKRVKGLYSASFNKRFDELRLSTTLVYNYKEYWDNTNEYRYNVILSQYMDVFNYKNVALSLSGYKSKTDSTNDKGAFLSVSIPWSNASSVTYNANMDKDNQVTHTMGFFNRVDERTNYRLNAGQSASGSTASAFINYDASVAKLSASASFAESQYSAFGLNAQGGVTLTSEGGALHRIGTPGNTRVLVDTNGAADIPVKGYGISTTSNMFGKAVVSDVRSYYRNKIAVDLNELPDTAEVSDSVNTATLTEGAIGYRKFDVISGQKMMTVIKRSDGTFPPFGSEVYNSEKYHVGIVGEEGYTYLSGINPNEVMSISLNDNSRCEIDIPRDLPSVEQSLFLICVEQSDQQMAKK